MHAAPRPTWLITGVTSGLGQAVAQAALARGDAVAGVVRRPSDAAAFTALAPDRATALIADMAQPDAIRRAANQAVATLGGIDILMNNAGQVLETTAEEAEPGAVRAIFDVNFHGPLALTQALLPSMRARGAGRIINISSGGGFVGLAALGIYCATKFALEGLSEALAVELAPFGIKVTIVEPGSFRTNLLAGNTISIPSSIAAYAASCGPWRATLAGMNGREPNDPARFAQAILRLADCQNPPLRLPLGRDALAMVDAKLAAIARDIEPWRALAATMAFEDASWYAPPPGQPQTS